MQTKALELLDIDVGVEAHLGRVRLDIRGIEAQALLKVRLEHITAIVDRLRTTLDRNPELVESIGRAVEHLGAGAEETLGQTGQAADELGSGARKGVAGTGEGVGRGAGGLGEEAEEGVAGGQGAALSGEAGQRRPPSVASRLRNRTPAACGVTCLTRLIRA